MVLEMGVENYNNECRSIVQRYTGEWEKTVTRLGRWYVYIKAFFVVNIKFYNAIFFSKD